MPSSAKFAVFVDRDGTICFDKHYMSDPADIDLIPTVADGIKKLNEADIPVVVVTNQSGVGRGYFTEEGLHAMHDRLRQILAAHGAKLDDIFYCPHRPDEGCSCRKPKPGMLLRAKEKHGFDIAKSFVIGDRMLDVEMAHAVGAKAVLVPEPGDQYNVDKEIRESKDEPDFRTETFMEAVDWVLERLRR
ncbi:MAG: HAD family hydrolase [Thermoplasmatota archaeon]